MLPDKPRDVKRLRTALDASRTSLRPHREGRLDLFKDFVGHYYGDGGLKKDMPVNAMAIAPMVYGRNLFARTPRVMVRTPHKELKWRANNLELLIGQNLKLMGFKPQMDAVIMNALFGMGVMKIGLTGAGTVNIGGQEIEYGQAYAKSVDFDDWVHDTAARTWEEIAFCGNRYRIPLEFAKAYEGFDEKVRKDLRLTSKHDYRQDGDRAEELGTGDEPQHERDEYEDYVELWDIWLPREGLLLTLPADGGETPLATVEWQGPRDGPYHTLGFIPVPNNIMPVAPASHWKDLNDLLNSLMRKLAKQAINMKEVTLVRPGGGDDAQRIEAANDGDIIRSDDPTQIGAVKYRGPDQATLLFALQVKTLENWMMGNLDAISGLSAQAETLGQEKLIQESSSRQLAEMQSRVTEFVRVVTKDVAWWVWTDERAVVPLTQKIPGTDLEVQTYFRPEDRKGQFLDYNLDIDPYSMREATPGERLAAIERFVQQMLPLLPVMQQEGFELNLEAFSRLYAKYANVPEVDDLLSFHRQPNPNQAGMVLPSTAGTVPKPAQTERIERRISMPGASRQGSDAIMGMMLSGQGVQQSEAASMRAA